MSGVASDTEAIERLLRRIRGIELRVNRLLDAGLAGAYRSLFRGRGIEAEGLREYTLDDDAALIDWQVSARTPRPHLRVFREERELVCLVLMDISASMACPVQGLIPRTAAVEAVALLALAALRNRDRVGLLLFATEIERWLPPGCSRAHALRVIREASCHEPTGRGTDLGAGLQAVSGLLPARSLVFLVSDMLAPLPEADLARLTGRHELTILRLLPPEPAWASVAATLWLEDAETGQCRPVCTGDALTAALRHQAARREGALRQAVRRCGADWVDLPCGPEAVPALAAYLTRRATAHGRAVVSGGRPA
jgi:uncharacterized protein (DUF58 family)